VRFSGGNCSTTTGAFHWFYVLKFVYARLRASAKVSLSAIAVRCRRVRRVTVRELYVQTRRQLKALGAVLELEGLE